MQDLSRHRYCYHELQVATGTEKDVKHFFDGDVRPKQFRFEYTGKNDLRNLGTSFGENGNHVRTWWDVTQKSDR